MVFGNAVGTNPVGELEQVTEEGDTYRSIGNMQLDYQTPLEGLKANLNLGYDVQLGERRAFRPSTVRSQAANNGEARIENFSRTSQLLEFYLKYERDIDAISSKFDVTGGYSYQQFNNSFPSFVVTDLPTDAFGFNDPSVAEEQSTNNSVLENRLISFYGRVNFHVQDKYLFTANIRRDGSTRFGPSNRWGIFPSAAFKWRILDEDFMSGVRGTLLDDLGFRIGWGVNGNQEIGDFLYIPRFDPGDGFARPQFGDSFVFTIRPSGVDTGLKWEETTQLNVGIDFSLFEGRLYGSIEYYNKVTEDLLFDAPVPALTNLKNIITTNVGSLENNGVELQLNATVLDKGDWRVDLGFNASYNQNELTKLNGNTSADFLGLEVGGISGGVGNTVQLLSVGDPAFTYWLYEHQRDDNGNLIQDTNPDGTSRPLTDIYVDQNEDGAIDNLDKVKQESPFPDWIMGLTGNVSYKNFDLNFTMRANLGAHVYNNLASFSGNYSRVITDIVPGNMHASVLKTGFVEPQIFSDSYLENASFLRMDNITLGYTVPTDKLNLRVYGTIQNLFVITNYSGLDPELGNPANDENPNSATFGIDNNVYPRSRAFVFGLNLGL
jgi:iron complex outermembrane receptor protein